MKRIINILLISFFSFCYVCFNPNYCQALGYESSQSDNAGINEQEPLMKSAKTSQTPLAIDYQTHIQNIGWQANVSNGAISGTSGRSLRLEGIKINLKNNESYTGTIQYRTHVQNIGWQNWVSNGQMAGTSGRSLRLEAIQIQLTGELAQNYDIYYRVHTQNLGWLDWTKNGERAGSAGYSYRLEAIQIELVEKNGNAPGSTAKPYVQRYIGYQTHVQNIGWQSKSYDGSTGGTSGRSLRLEGIKISLDNPLYSGNVEYRTHIQNIGWETSWKRNGNMSGTSGRSLRLEAIQIRLTGEMSNQYDIYYRVHAQDYGWLGWTKNGASAGTEGLSKRLEAIQIVLVKKGGSAPGSTTRPFVKYNSWVANLKASKNYSQLVVVSVYNTNYATVSMHTKGSDGYWTDDFSVTGRIGKNGLNKKAEGDKKTPTGIYQLHTPFGIKPNPGCPLNYTQVNKYHYWGGGDASYYNRLVDSRKINNYNSKGAEHIIDYGKVYNYCVAVGYNMEQIVGKGSAIFLHCSTQSATPGCISIPENNMIQLLRNIHSDARIIIDYSYNINNY